MPVPELEALIYLYETCGRQARPSCSTAIKDLLSISGLPDNAPRRKVPDSLSLGHARVLLAPFTSAVQGPGGQVDLLLEALLGEEWGVVRDCGVGVDDLLLLAAFMASDSRANRVHLAFWALDREGKGHLTRQQVMRAVDPLMAVARVGAMLQCIEAGRAYQTPLGSPATRSLMFAVLGRSLDSGDPSHPAALPEPAFDRLLDATAGQLSAIIFEQATTAAAGGATAAAPGSSTATSSLPPSLGTHSSDPHGRPSEAHHAAPAPQPRSPTSPLHLPPLAAPDHALMHHSPSAETHSTYRTTMDHGGTPTRHSPHPSDGSRPPSVSLPHIRTTSEGGSPDGPIYLNVDSSSTRTSRTHLSALRDSLHSAMHPHPDPRSQQLHPYSPPPPPFQAPPRLRMPMQAHPPPVQVIPSSLTLQVERAEDSQRRGEELSRGAAAATRTTLQRVTGREQGGVYQSLQSTILDTSLRVFALCSGSLLVLLAVLFMNAALIVFLYRTRRLRLEVSLAVTVGFNLGLVGVLACSIFIRSKCGACKAAAAAASRRSQDGRQEGIQLDGIIPPFLQPLIKRFLVTFHNESDRAAGAPPAPHPGDPHGDPQPQDGWSSKLRAVWATVGRMAGFDVHPPPAGQESGSFHPNDSIRTPQSESPEFRNSGRHMSNHAYLPPPMRSWNALVPSNVVREAYRDF